MKFVELELRQGLRSLSPEQLDELMWRFLSFLKFGKRRKPKHKFRTVEEKVSKVFELIKKLKR